MVRHFTKVIFLVLILLGVVPSIQAAQSREEVSFVPSDSVASMAWSVLVDLWNVLTGPWGENGCEFDPDGKCAPRLGAATVDNGCELDPNGGCARHPRATLSKNGCEVDPSGQCGPRQGTATIDNGCEFDPNGGCRR
jgi:hypothetical protein